MTAPIRLFVSSPSDVAAERQAVERVARRVEGLFDGVKIEVYRWEKDHYYSAHTGFQEQIAEIGGFDLVVGVLWSRLGSPLPPGFAARMPPPREGEPYPSGTAFELLEAIRLRRERDHAPPDIFVYRKLAPPNLAAADDDAAQAQLLADLQGVNRFMGDFFVNAQDGFKAAFKTFLTLDTFEAALEADLTAWLKANHRLESPRPWRIEERGAPFVGLDAFDASHREVFFGRRPEIERARERLEAGQGFLLIDGASGSGKSSLARAGLLPRLTDLDPHLGVAITVPETETPLLALVQALFGSAALPDLAQGDYPQPAALTRHLLAGGDVAPILRALDRAGHRLMAEDQLDAPPPLTLLLLVDQLEGLFASRVPAAERAAYAGLLEHLVESGRARVIATLRANVREAALAIPSLGRLINANRGLALEPPTADALGEIIRAPAATAGITYERDAQGVGLDEVLLAEVAKDPAALPLLQFALERLYQIATDKVRAEGLRLGDVPPGTPVLTLTQADYAALGGLSGAIGHQAEAALRDLKEASRAKLPALVRALTESGGGALVLGRAPLGRAAPDDESRALIEALVAARILVQGMSAEGDGPPVPTLRFSHERVLTAWDRARDAAQAAATYIRIRADLVQAEARWREAGRKKDELLSSRARLGEAEDAVRDYGVELDRLDPGIRAYVKASTRRAQWRQRLAFALTGVFLVMALAAIWFATDAQLQRSSADELRLIAEQEARTALQNQRNAMVALALSRASTEPHEAIALVLATWPKNSKEPFPSLSLVRQALSDALSGTRPHQLLVGHSGWVNSAAFSPDGSLVASGGNDGTLRFWDAEGEAQLGNPIDANGDWGWVNSVSFSPDGSRVVTAGDDGSLRIWNVDTRVWLSESTPSGLGRIWSATFAPDGARIIVGATNGLMVWNSNGGAELIDQPGSVLCAAFSPEGDQFVSGGSDGTLRLWNFSSSGVSVSELLVGHESEVLSVAFSPTGRLVVSAGADGTIRIWDSANGEAIGDPILGHEGSVQSVGFSPDGALIVSGGDDGTLRIWDADNRAPASRPIMGHTGAVRTVAFSQDGESVISGGADGTLRIWDVSSIFPIEEATVHQAGEFLSVSYSARLNKFVTGDTDGALQFWDAFPGALPRTIVNLPNTWMADVAFSPDGTFIASRGESGSLRLWNADSGAPLNVFWGHQGIVTSLEISPDGRQIASGGNDGTLRLWDVGTGEELWEPLRPHKYEVPSLAFSPDGHTIVTGGDDGTLRLWNATNGSPIGEPMLGHEGYVSSLAFSPNGSSIVSGGADGTVRVWDFYAQHELFDPLLGHQGQVTTVAFSPSGSHIISASHDGTLRVWDAISGTAIGVPLYGHDDWVNDVAFLLEGQQAVSVGKDGTIRLWSNLPTENFLQVACRYLPHVNGRPAFSTEGLAKELGLTNLTLPEDCDTYDPPLPPLAVSLGE